MQITCVCGCVRVCVRAWLFACVPMLVVSQCSGRRGRLGGPSCGRTSRVLVCVCICVHVCVHGCVVVVRVCFWLCEHIGVAIIGRLLLEGCWLFVAGCPCSATLLVVGCVPMLLVFSIGCIGCSVQLSRQARPPWRPELRAYESSTGVCVHLCFCVCAWLRCGCLWLLLVV